LLGASPWRAAILMLQIQLNRPRVDSYNQMPA
jgi:hypothetical protein